MYCTTTSGSVVQMYTNVLYYYTTTSGSVEQGYSNVLYNCFTTSGLVSSDFFAKAEGANPGSFSSFSSTLALSYSTSPGNVHYNVFVFYYKFHEFNLKPNELRHFRRKFRLSVCPSWSNCFDLFTFFQTGKPY
jgi:hypothetical protein